MIKTTEVTRRELYASIKRTWEFTSPYSTTGRFLEKTENALESHLEALRQEHDDLRNRLQAFEFANKSAGDLLRDALATVKRQREFIRTLYTSRKARKSKRATRIQSSDENSAETICGPLLSLCQHSWRDQFADLSGKRQKQCIFCLTIQES